MKFIYLVLTLLLLAATTSYAQVINGRLTTSVYGWQGRTATSALDKVTYLRGYENVQLDVFHEKFSFSTNFQVANDFASTLSQDPELRLSTFSLKARRIADMIDISAGRQYVFAGVGNGIIDGAVTKFSYMDGKVTAQLYGGYNVIQTRTINLNKKLLDNGLYGGQITATPLQDMIVGFSYMKRTHKPDAVTLQRVDSLFHPYTVVMYYSPTEEDYASFDAEYLFSTKLRTYGRFDYDLNFERIARGELVARVGVMNQLNVTAEYIYRQPRLGYNSIFSVFSTNSTQEIEGGVEYDFSSTFRTFARFGYVKYVDDNSQRIRFGGTYEFLSAAFTKNLGYAGDLNGLSLQAAYPMMEQLITPTLGVGYASYKLAKDAPSNTTMNGMVGVTYRLTTILSADVQLQYIKNTLYDSDTRIFVKFSYLFNKRLGLI